MRAVDSQLELGAGIMELAGKVALVTGAGSGMASANPVCWRTRSAVTPGCRLRTSMRQVSGW